MKDFHLPFNFASILTLACSLAASSCATPLTPYNLVVRLSSDKPIVQRLDASRSLIEKRKRQAYQFTLAEKAAIFEVQQDSYKLPGPFKEQYSHRFRADAGPSLASPAFANERLAMLSYKYKAIGDKKILEEINSLLETHLRLDRLFGNPGQLPQYVVYSNLPPDKMKTHRPDFYLYECREDLCIYFQDDAHGNTFPNHFFGLYSAYTLTDDEKIKRKVSGAVKNHITYLLDEGFVLKRLDGDPSSYGDLTGKEYFGFAKNALLARLMLLEVSLCILSDQPSLHRVEPIISRIEKQLAKLRKKGVLEKIQDMSSMIGNLSFSTPPSDRRVFLNLHLLTSASGKRDYGKKYANAFNNYWEFKKKDYNPFYTFIYLASKPKETWSFEDRIINAVTLEYMRSFPLDRDNREVLNSFFKDNDIDIDRFPVITKHGLVPRNKTPLPIYRRGVRSHEWRHNAFRLNENLNREGLTVSHPLDFLLVYYMGLAQNFIPHEEKAFDKEKVEVYCRSSAVRH